MHRIILFIILFSNMQNGNKRVLRIYTPGLNNTAYIQQLKMLERDKRGLNERDVAIETRIAEKAGFEVVLTGKDGAAKLKSDTPVTLKQLFTLIDGMPMRKEEMRKREN